MTGVPKLVIRRPNPEQFAHDADSVTALMLAARRKALPKVKVVRTEAETYVWMREVVFPRRSIRIAQLGDEYVGFAARDGAWLELLYVRPGWTGKGIGRELLEVVINEAKTIIPVLRLSSYQCNPDARRFFEQNGFTVVATGDGTGNEEGEPDFRFERPLR